MRSYVHFTALLALLLATKLEAQTEPALKESLKSGRRELVLDKSEPRSAVQNLKRKIAPTTGTLTAEVTPAEATDKVVTLEPEPGALEPWNGVSLPPAPGRRVEFDAAPRSTDGRAWVSNDVLLWWIQGLKLPPLVTTSPIGTPAAGAGVLNAPGTNLLFGQSEANEDLRLGDRFRAGYWLDDEQRCSVEVHALILESGSTSFDRTSDGSTILALPFTNAVNGNAASSLIAFPGTSAGSVVIDARTGIFGSAGIVLRENFCRDGTECNTCNLCNGGGCATCGSACGGPWNYRFDSLFGYRYLRLNERLTINTDVTALPGGARTLTSDEFETTNDFHGLDLGVTGEVRRGRFFADVLAKVAVGYNQASATASGLRTTAAGTQVGGLFTQPNTNIGTLDRCEPTAVPELGVKLGYQAGNLRTYVGYTFLYWYHVARAGDQVDPFIDPSFTPGQGAGAVPPTRPAGLFQDTDIWVQGVSVGIEWRY